MAAELRLSGELDQLALAEVFAHLARTRATGELRVFEPDARDPATHRVVHFHEGRPVDVPARTSDDALSRAVIDRGLVDAATRDRAVKVAGETKQTLRQALVAAGELRDADIAGCLSVVALEGAIEAFAITEGRYSFRRDGRIKRDNARSLISGREVVEAALHSTLGAEGVETFWQSYVSDGLIATPEAAPPDTLTDDDRAILSAMVDKQAIDQQLEHITQHAKLSRAAARLRVLTYLTFDAVRFSDAALQDVRDADMRLRALDYYDVLDVPRDVTPDAATLAVETKFDELGARPQTTDSEGLAAARSRVARRLEAARRALGDPALSAMYARACEFGIDSERPDEEASLAHDFFISSGTRRLEAEDWSAAAADFARAAEAMPDDTDAHVQHAWARFMASDRGEVSANAATEILERAVRSDEDRDLPHLFLGRVWRTAGNNVRAERHLRRALTLSPNNKETQRELQTLTIADRPSMPDRGTRRTGSMATVAASRTTGATAAVRRSPSVASGASIVGPVVMFATVAAILTIGAQFVPGGALNEPIRGGKQFLPHLQVLGNSESYYVIGDAWWWIRRAVLLFAAVIGMNVMTRDDDDGLVWLGEHTKWLGIAIPYGLVVGYFSPLQTVVGTAPQVLGMTLVHVLCEQLFFIGFFARTLLARLRNPHIAIAITAIAFGAYHGSYLHFRVADLELVVPQLLQISVFAGGAYAIAFWKSGGLLASLLAHLIVNGLMMIRSVMPDFG